MKLKGQTKKQATHIGRETKRGKVFGGMPIGKSELRTRVKNRIETLNPNKKKITPAKKSLFHRLFSK